MSKLSTDDVIAIIPARYASTRFPGKPLAIIDGVTMIERVYRSAEAAVGRVVVATDDERIRTAVEAFGGEVVMTSPDCPNGTARVAEAYRTLGEPAEIVVDVQGDEPFVQSAQIADVARVLIDNPDVKISTLALQFDPAEGFESLFDSNRVKMVLDGEGRALCFSRSIVPYVRDVPWQEWIYTTTFHIHVGLYGFRGSELTRLVSLAPSPIDTAENLEQLRWLYNGYEIRTAMTTVRTYPVDTPEDLERINRREK